MRDEAQAGRVLVPGGGGQVAVDVAGVRNLRVLHAQSLQLLDEQLCKVKLLLRCGRCLDVVDARGADAGVFNKPFVCFFIGSVPSFARFTAKYDNTKCTAEEEKISAPYFSDFSDFL